MAHKICTQREGEIKFDVRTPTREELLQVADLCNGDVDWNMPVDIFYDIYDVETQGFRVAVDKSGQVLSKIRLA